MEDVYAWVECRGVLEGGNQEESEMSESEEEELLKGYGHVYNFKLVNPWPRKVFECGPGGGTVGDHLWPSGNIIVEEELEEEEEDGPHGGVTEK